MAAMDEWIDESENLADETAANAKRLTQFQLGSWWAAFELGPSPWPKLQGLRNRLVTVDPGKPYTERIAKRLVFAWILGDATSSYWHVSLDGFGYCRVTLSEDFVDRPSVKPQVRFFRRRPIGDALAVFNYIRRLSDDPFSVQMGWLGLKNRTLIDPTANEWDCGTSDKNEAKSDLLRLKHDELAGKGIAIAIHSLTKELYRAFGDTKVTVDVIDRWLQEPNA